MKAIALLSGGLDSTLAVRMILEQGIEVEALKFTSPFCQCDHGGKCYSAEVARELNIPIKTIHKGEDYLSVIKQPKHGYGSGINPCMDCRIYMLRKAKEYADSTGANFIFTGEVLGQRPMSQHRRALEIIERESGLEGELLRPLSAKHLPETRAEKCGWVDRDRLLGISGRSRKVQYKMAKDFNISNFSCPAGGCLLTDRNFARRMRDFIDNSETLTTRDIILLKTGRHFRYNGDKIVLGRNEMENETLTWNKSDSDMVFAVRDFVGPVTLLQGHGSEDAVRLAAIMTAAYSDALEGDVAVQIGKGDHDKHQISVMKTDKEKFSSYRI